MKCAITGHRNVENPVIARLEIQRKLMEAYKAGCRTFLSGMAEGIDTWAVEFLDICRKQYGMNDIEIWAVLPYKGFGRNNRLRNHLIVDVCDRVVCVCEEYDKWCYGKRDRWLVNNCDMFASYYDGRKGGGTRFTVGMMKRKGIPEAGEPEPEESQTVMREIQSLFDEIERKGTDAIIRGCMGNASEAEIEMAIVEARETRRMQEARKRDLKFRQERLAENEWIGATIGRRK